MEQRVSDPDGSPNAQTVESYELIAEDYARETAGSRVMFEALTRLADAIPSGHVLEIGSGPGWDADTLEEAGLTVRRTDVTQAFIDLQQARGKAVDRLDVITDDFDGPYDAVVALAVLQHVPPHELANVLAKVAGAVRPGGQFLVALRLGAGVGWEVGESGNRYYLSFWPEDEFIAELDQVGLTSAWSHRATDTDDPDRAANPWLTLLAQLRPTYY